MGAIADVIGQRERESADSLRYDTSTMPCVRSDRLRGEDLPVANYHIGMMDIMVLAGANLAHQKGAMRRFGCAHFRMEPERPGPRMKW